MVGGQRDSAGLDCSVIIGDFLLIGSQALTLTSGPSTATLGSASTVISCMCVDLWKCFRRSNFSKVFSLRTPTYLYRGHLFFPLELFHEHLK